MSDVRHCESEWWGEAAGPYAQSLWQSRTPKWNKKDVKRAGSHETGQVVRAQLPKQSLDESPELGKTLLTILYYLNPTLYPFAFRSRERGWLWLRLWSKVLVSQTQHHGQHPVFHILFIFKKFNMSKKHTWPYFGLVK